MGELVLREGKYLPHTIQQVHDRSGISVQVGGTPVSSKLQRHRLLITWKKDLPHSPAVLCALLHGRHPFEQCHLHPSTRILVLALPWPPAVSQFSHLQNVVGNLVAQSPG